MRRPAIGRLGLALALACWIPISAAAQPTAVGTSAGTPDPAGSRRWIATGGASTTIRGDCQECEEDSDYRHTGSLVADVGIRVNSRMDAGVELGWVPVSTDTGDDIRTTFLLAVAQFRPWESRGLFVKAGMGMAFVRNWVIDLSGGEDSPPFTSKALGLTYGVGWAFRRSSRVGLQVLGSQNVVALGDLETSQSRFENVVANYWSVGAAIVVR